MKVSGEWRRSIELVEDSRGIRILDQTLLPHAVVWRDLEDLESAAEAIETMRVRGAPLIGATAACGVWLALKRDSEAGALETACARLLATRPTAVNLRWAVERMHHALVDLSGPDLAEAAWREASAIVEEDARSNREIGRHAMGLLAEAKARKAGQGPLQVMTHCNAGWLACVDWGTALSGVYLAHEAGMDLHVWVSETRPRSQGAALTAWELGEHGVPHTVVSDNAAGHLMQRGLVDLCLVGADRVSAAGDAANKIGTYLKALAAREHDLPFYVAAPCSTIDWTIRDGIAGIPIERRDAREITHVVGATDDGRREEVRIVPAASPARNDAFDVTPARFVTALVTERGAVDASETGLSSLRS